MPLPCSPAPPPASTVPDRRTSRRPPTFVIAHPVRTTFADEHPVTLKSGCSAPLSAGPVTTARWRLQADRARSGFERIILLWDGPLLAPARCRRGWPPIAGSSTQVTCRSVGGGQVVPRDQRVGTSASTTPRPNWPGKRSCADSTSSTPSTCSNNQDGARLESCTSVRLSCNTRITTGTFRPSRRAQNRPKARTRDLHLSFKEPNYGELTASWSDNVHGAQRRLGERANSLLNQLQPCADPRLP